MLANLLLFNQAAYNLEHFYARLTILKVIDQIVQTVVGIAWI
jgi:hypothetical protein